jgi:branched-subunit amino acid transport protein
LRYTAVAVLPALVAPAVLWPPATAGALDPVRLGAIAVTLLAEVLTRNMIAAIGAGGVAFYLLPVMLGAA